MWQVKFFQWLPQKLNRYHSNAFQFFSSASDNVKSQFSLTHRHHSCCCLHSNKNQLNFYFLLTIRNAIYTKHIENIVTQISKIFYVFSKWKLHFFNKDLILFRAITSLQAKVYENLKKTINYSEFLLKYFRPFHISNLRRPPQFTWILILWNRDDNKSAEC